MNALELQHELEKLDPAAEVYLCIEEGDAENIRLGLEIKVDDNGDFVLLTSQLDHESDWGGVTGVETEYKRAHAVAKAPPLLAALERSSRTPLDAQTFITLDEWRKTRKRVNRVEDPKLFAECLEIHLGGEGEEPESEGVIAYHVYRGGHFISEEIHDDGETMLCLFIEQEDFSIACTGRILDGEGRQLEEELYRWVCSSHPELLRR